MHEMFVHCCAKVKPLIHLTRKIVQTDKGVCIDQQGTLPPNIQTKNTLPTKQHRARPNKQGTRGRIDIPDYSE